MAYSTDTTGNAATADKLKTARTINGVSFDGSANIKTDNNWVPSNYNWLAWTFDPVNIFGNYALNAGFLFVSQLQIPVATTITNVVMMVAAAGSGLTSGQNFAGLYQNGNLLASTADQTSAWASTGLKTMALSTPQTVSAGTIHVAVSANGTTRPGFSVGPASFYGIVGPAYNASGNNRFGYTNTGITTALPSTLGTFTTSGVTLWAAVS